MQKKKSAGILTALIIMIGVSVWTSRTVSAQQPGHPASRSGWHQRLHAELMGMLPECAQQHLRASHSSH